MAEMTAGTSVNSRGYGNNPPAGDNGQPSAKAFYYVLGVQFTD